MLLHLTHLLPPPADTHNVRGTERQFPFQMSGTHSPAVLAAQLSSRIFQNDRRDSVQKDEVGEIHRCVRAEEREERVLPDAKLRLSSAASPPLTCPLALPLSLALFIPALTLHRDFSMPACSLSKSSMARRGGHLQASHDLILGTVSEIIIEVSFGMGAIFVKVASTQFYENIWWTKII